MDIFILEDHWVQQVYLEKIIHQVEASRHIPVTNIRSFSNKNDLLQNLPTPSIENVFLLDLEIGDDRQAGLKISQKIRQNDLLASIIFVTIHDELLPKTYTYEAEALDFIAKDSDNIKEKITRDLLRINDKNKHSSNPNAIMLKVTSGYRRISLTDIVFFEPNHSNSHQSFLHTTNNQIITVNATLNQLESKSDQLFRSHRRCLVNINKITQVNTHDHTIILAGYSQSLPLSRLKNTHLISLLNNLNQPVQFN